ncbi:MAG: hypothetical protein A2V93_00675 [Ignavibacteria bacterium RBG_16_34_14]|nr:MAG: hypothetical protein A2V93_00675 [Ignavibacteria bacterium RBG_16_34_14]
MNKKGNDSPSLEIRVADFEGKITKLHDRVTAKKLFQQDAEGIRRRFIEGKKVGTALYDKFLKFCNLLSEKINGMNNIAESMKLKNGK